MGKNHSGEMNKQQGPTMRVKGRATITVGGGKVAVVVGTDALPTKHQNDNDSNSELEQSSAKVGTVLKTMQMNSFAHCPQQ